MRSTDTEYLYSSAASVGKAAGNSFSGPLPPTVRQQYEAFFAADLSDVTVHVSHAATLVGADAFTVANDIFFAPGSYNPFSKAGDQLLGHELAHVVQQSAGAASAEVASDYIASAGPASE